MVTLYAKAWLFFEENRTLVYGALAGLVLLAAGVAGYLYYQTQQQAAAEEELARIVRTYEQGSYQAALDGTGNAMGLLAISDNYSGTQAGNLATYYAADALYRLGEYDRALGLFQDYEATEDFIGASALAAQAAIHANRSEFDRAASLYVDAAEQYPNSLTTPKYLMSAGKAYEEAGDYSAAIDAYQRIEDEYPESSFAQQVPRYIARAEARQAAAS
jgi:tetratricopeptide (TPR) repeat protein